MKKVTKKELRKMIKNGEDVTQVDTSNITDMSGLFAYCVHFNQDISRWDVSNVTNMYSMFFNCYDFNQDISRWDVSNVTNMYSMFFNCKNFNQDLSNWNISNVKDLPKDMFWNCPAHFNLKYWKKQKEMLNNLTSI